MSIFNTTDKLEVKGFINKDDILKYITEEQIFQLVFGFQPKEYDYVSSPFREDDNPGCWFCYSPNNGKLKFSDFGSQTYIKGVRMTSIDCFDAVQIYFKLNNLYETLCFIKDKLIKGKDIESIQHKVFLKKKRTGVLIDFEPRTFNENDKRHWSKFQITSSQLIEDKVFATKRFKASNTKNGDWNCRTYDLCYAYTEFADGRKKLYRPYQKGSKRFITNCNQNDIGGLHTLEETGDLLVITKSYKDWRVLRNHGIRNCIWFQNEGQIPDSDVLLPILSRFKRIVVFFDNDTTGILQSKRVANMINSHLFDKATNLYLPEYYSTELISDPSDLLWKKGNTVLNNFLYQNNLL